MLRAAVIGVGFLGKFHAEKYAKLDNVELVAVVDTDEKQAQSVSESLGVPFTHDYRDLLGKVDCVSIVVPTQNHYDISRFFLENKVHVLVEKPITETLEQAEHLIQLAKENHLKLQVGHLERFNPVILELKKRLGKLHFIESNRLAAFNLRALDVNVILDLMIHDIDIIQSIVDSPIVSIDAIGSQVLSQKIDIANARIRFANHCVADVTASRVSLKSERKMRLFQNDAYFSLDMQTPEMKVYRKGEGEMFPGIPNIEHEDLNYEKPDALMAETIAFLEAIENDTTPMVTGEDGLASLKTAHEITKIIEDLPAKMAEEEAV